MDRLSYLERVRALTTGQSDQEQVVDWVARALDNNLPKNPSPEHEALVIDRLGDPEAQVAKARESIQGADTRSDQMIKVWAGLAVLSAVVLFPLPLLAIPLAGLAVSMAFKRDTRSLERTNAIVFSTVTVIVACVVAFSPGLTDHLRDWSTIIIATVGLVGFSAAVTLLVHKRR